MDRGFPQLRIDTGTSTGPTLRLRVAHSRNILGAIAEDWACVGRPRFHPLSVRQRSERFDESMPSPSQRSSSMRFRCWSELRTTSSCARAFGATGSFSKAPSSASSAVGAPACSPRGRRQPCCAPPRSAVRYCFVGTGDPRFQASDDENIRKNRGLSTTAEYRPARTSATTSIARNRE